MRRHRTIIISVLILSGGGARLDAQAPPDLSPLPREVEHTLFLRACGLFNREALPPGSPYIPGRAVCGTPVVMALASNWHRLSKTTREAFATLFQRPVAERTEMSPKRHFRIHYNRTGSHAVHPADADRNNVPDYVDEVGRTLEDVRDLQIGRMRYDPPPSDGDGVYDIYIRNLAGKSVYGFAYPIVRDDGPPVSASYMEIDNNYTDNIYETRGLDGLHVTAAHEFFHAVQFGYYNDIYTSAWWHELTSTWMEDVAYTDVNDYYQYIPEFFQFPGVSLDQDPVDVHVFGASVYAHYLAKVYGEASIRRSWEVLKEREPSDAGLEHYDAGMPAGGFAGVFPGFAVWNYLTNIRARPGYYPEAGNYPSVGADTAVPGPGMPASGYGNVDHLAANYIRVFPKGLSGGLRGAFMLDRDATWTLLVLLISDRVEVVRASDASRVEIPDVQRYEQVVFVPIVTSLEGKRFRYSYTISVDEGITRASDPVGDLNFDGRVNFADFVSFAGGFGKKPDAEGYHQRADLNGDGEIDFQDFVIFARHFCE